MEINWKTMSRWLKFRIIMSGLFALSIFIVGLAVGSPIHISLTVGIALGLGMFVMTSQWWENRERLRDEESAITRNSYLEEKGRLLAQRNHGGGRTNIIINSQMRRPVSRDLLGRPRGETPRNLDRVMRYPSKNYRKDWWK
jgi:hypothetical protein